ncbi:uncharacterized protein LOC134035296 isoform X2 [Osmerus eperlanus]|uniref:uncharacterized protein LOC134035296 isoform X2 n=1 Tax=Osmerus eperlanus TaxID=29151 RepID=UPI002E1671A7
MQKKMRETDNEVAKKPVLAKHAKKTARRVVLPQASNPNHLTSSDDSTYIGSPQRLNFGNDLEFGLSSTQKMLMDDNSHGVAPRVDEIMASLRDLPEMIKLMKECVECVKALMPLAGGTPSSAMSSSSLSVESDIEMHHLAGSTVTVSKRAFLRLSRTRMTIFAQELAVLVFTKEVLAQSTLTGKSGKGGVPKGQLDVDKVRAITMLRNYTVIG